MLSVVKDRGVIPYAEKGNVGNKKSDDITRYKVVRPGDIVVNCMNVIIGSVGRSRYTGCLSPVYYVLMPRSEGDDPRYLNAYFQVKTFQKSLIRIGNGILAHRMRIPMELLKSEPFPRPPIEEQSAIVRFLDYADRRIRRYIRAKKKLIVLLNEEKQAIIHRAVTRGLDPNARFKPSGVEWLGEVPGHWEVVRLKSVCKVQGGYAFPSSDFGDAGVPVVRMNNLRRGTLSLKNSVRIAESKYLPAFSLNAGDVLYGLSGSIGSTGSLGNYAIVRESDLPAQLNQRVARFSVLTKRIVLDYLALIVQTTEFYEQVLAGTTGTAQFNVSTNDLEAIYLALPSVLEQEEIVTRIASRAKLLSTAINAAAWEIDLLYEYRTRLIADVVTGKLDVRAAAARLPEEAEEPEPLDEAEAMGEEDAEGEGTDLDALSEEAVA